MLVWIPVALGLLCGITIIAGVFWITFRRVPERRSDGGLTQHDAANYASFISHDKTSDN